jgi:hypothetical protein
MTTFYEVDVTFTSLELPSPTFPLPFSYVVMIFPIHPPLVILPTEWLYDDVSLIVPHDVLCEVMFGVLLSLVNLPLLSICSFMHYTYNDFK